jgi:hypothetical protein
MNVHEWGTLAAATGQLALGLLAALYGGGQPAGAAAQPPLLLRLRLEHRRPGLLVSGDRAWNFLDHALSPMTAPLFLQFVLVFTGQRRRLAGVLHAAYALVGLLAASAIRALSGSRPGPSSSAPPGRSSTSRSRCPSSPWASPASSPPGARTTSRLAARAPHPRRARPRRAAGGDRSPAQRRPRRDAALANLAMLLMAVVLTVVTLRLRCSGAIFRQQRHLRHGAGAAGGRLLRRPLVGVSASPEALLLLMVTAALMVGVLVRASAGVWAARQSARRSW